MRRSLATLPSTVVLALTSLLLPACPLTDDYYVEQAQGGQGGVGANTGGSTHSSGGSTLGCDDLECSADCCSGVCTDFDSDDSNCGSCGRTCSGAQTCSSGACHGWGSMAEPPSQFVGRQGAAYTVADGRIFIFGGLDGSGNALNDGALYDPSSDSWTLVSVDANTPSPRQLASALWTGSQVMVVGGTAGVATAALIGVASYDPLTDTWDSHSALNTARVSPYLAYANGAEQLLVWGGYDGSGAAVAGGEYSATGAVDWTGVPNLYCSYVTCYSVAIDDLTWADTGSRAYLFGGRWNGTTQSAYGYEYVPASHAWSPRSYASGPSARWGAFGAWDGASFFVWGGNSDSGLLSDGSSYANTTWTTLTASPLSARYAPHRRSGWALALGEGSVAVLGGVDASGTPLTDGAHYESDAWTAIDDWPSGEAHEYGVAVAINAEVFLWGGLDGSSVTATGERWAP